MSTLKTLKNTLHSTAFIAKTPQKIVMTKSSLKKAHGEFWQISNARHKINRGQGFDALEEQWQLLVKNYIFCSLLWHYPIMSRIHKALKMNVKLENHYICMTDDCNDSTRLYLCEHHQNVDNERKAIVSNMFMWALNCRPVGRYAPTQSYYYNLYCLLAGQITYIYNVWVSFLMSEGYSAESANAVVFVYMVDNC